MKTFWSPKSSIHFRVSASYPSKYGNVLMLFITSLKSEGPEETLNDNVSPELFIASGFSSK